MAKKSRSNSATKRHSKCYVYITKTLLILDVTEEGYDEVRRMLLFLHGTKQKKNLGSGCEMW